MMNVPVSPSKSNEVDMPMDLVGDFRPKHPNLLANIEEIHNSISSYNQTETSDTSTCSFLISQQPINPSQFHPNDFPNFRSSQFKGCHKRTSAMIINENVFREDSSGWSYTRAPIHNMGIPFHDSDNLNVEDCNSNHSTNSLMFPQTYNLNDLPDNGLLDMTLPGVHEDLVSDSIINDSTVTEDLASISSTVLDLSPNQGLHPHSYTSDAAELFSSHSPLLSTQIPHINMRSNDGESIPNETFSSAHSSNLEHPSNFHNSIHPLPNMNSSLFYQCVDNCPPSLSRNVGNDAIRYSASLPEYMISAPRIGNHVHPPHLPLPQGHDAFHPQLIDESARLDHNTYLSHEIDASHANEILSFNQINSLDSKQMSSFLNKGNCSEPSLLMQNPPLHKELIDVYSLQYHLCPSPAIKQTFDSNNSHHQTCPTTDIKQTFESNNPQHHPCSSSTIRQTFDSNNPQLCKTSPHQKVKSRMIDQHMQNPEQNSNCGFETILDDKVEYQMNHSVNLLLRDTKYDKEPSENDENSLLDYSKSSHMIARQTSSNGYERHYYDEPSPSIHTQNIQQILEHKSEWQNDSEIPPTLKPSFEGRFEANPNAEAEPPSDKDSSNRAEKVDIVLEVPPPDKLDLTYYICTACDFIVEDVSQMAEHLKQAHNLTVRVNWLEEQPVETPSPVEVVDNLNSLEKDENKSPKPKPHKNLFFCLKCYWFFDTLETFQSHEKCKNSIYKCDLCNMMFSLKDRFSRHKKTCFIENEPKPKGKVKKRTNTKSQDGKKVMAAKEITCDICDEVFHTRTSYRYHKRKHTGEKPYKCQRCGMAFRLLSTLKSHVLIHTGLRPFVCDTCDSSFNQKSALRRHYRLHKKREGYRCGVCDTKIMDRCNYVRHVASHEIKDIIKCPLCDCKFRSQTQLEKHVDTHKPDEKPFRCTTCTADFNSLKYLNQHVRRVHLNKNSIVCSECKATFNRMETYKSHMEVHKGNALFECKTCGAKFNQKVTLKKHMYKQMHFDDTFNQHKKKETTRSKNTLSSISEITKSDSEKTKNNSINDKALKQNQSNITTNEQLHCSVCNQNFFRKRQFNAHKKTCNLRSTDNSSEENQNREKESSLNKETDLREEFQRKHSPGLREESPRKERHNPGLREESSRKEQHNPEPSFMNSFIHRKESSHNSEEVIDYILPSSYKHFKQNKEKVWKKVLISEPS